MKKILILVVLCLWQTAVSAQCDATNDIEQSSTSNWYVITPQIDNVGQTFTLTCSSTIEGVTLTTQKVSDDTFGEVSVKVELYSDPLDSSTRTLITSQTQDIPFHSATGPNIKHYFSFSDLPQIQAGTQYRNI